MNTRVIILLGLLGLLGGGIVFYFCGRSRSYEETQLAKGFEMGLPLK